MKAFMDKEFMLQSPTAQHLYHAYAEDMPICDYHCHIPPREIYENRRFDNIAQVWLGGRNPDGSYFGDHYKWRVMRSNGVPEEYITGDKPDRERFQKFAEALPMAIGNPMYHWTNLELHTFFGYDGVLNGDTAEEVWNLCNDKLQHDPKLTVRGLIEQSNVAFIGTTDDPIDSLEWHKKIKEDPTIKFTVAPSFRPDKALNINKPGFAEYMGKLAAAVGKEKLACINCVTSALTDRIEFLPRWAAALLTTVWTTSPTVRPPRKRSTPSTRRSWPARPALRKRLRSIRPTSSSTWASSITASASPCRSTTTACAASTAR